MSTEKEGTGNDQLPDEKKALVPGELKLVKSLKERNLEKKKKLIEDGTTVEEKQTVYQRDEDGKILRDDEGRALTETKTVEHLAYRGDSKNRRTGLSPKERNLVNKEAAQAAIAEELEEIAASKKFEEERKKKKEEKNAKKSQRTGAGK